MEDDNGLELSLGLSCGGSSGKSKGRDVSSDTKLDEGSSSKLLGGIITASDVSFKNFFQTSAENQVHSGKQKGDPVSQLHENFWTGLGKHPATGADGSKDVQSSQSQFTRYQQPWIPNNKTTDTEEEKSSINKRRLSFEEINIQKKHEKVVVHGDAHSKGPAGMKLLKKSHISVTTEDGSSGENEDVAESEAEGSNSWLVSQHEDSSKCSEVPKVTDKHVLNDQSGINFQGQRQPPFSGNDSNPEIGKVTYGIPLPLQPLTVMTVPYPVPVKVPTTAGVPNATGFSSPCIMQLMPLANSEQPVVQTMNTSNLQLAFGYSPVQLPTLETSSSWAFGSQPQHASSFAIKDNADGASQHSEDDVKRSHAFTYEGKSSELAKGSGKPIGEAGASSSSQVEEEGKGSNTIVRQKETTNQPAAASLSYEGCAIKPGMFASNLKFGGCGSYPDLPWVSTTGPGPNGKTISGVTYKYDRNQIKIVCACHGSHMTPEQFIEHASADASNLENNTSLASFPASNPAASAQN
ncbi:protein NINJA homolog 1-like [Phoenix dactylifera]|uniref:Ninja-family protein n=1 Tax=Phoenix dactylifera TaxID=42345 RepID=A0A8B7CL24_PHODC|nr:protein NINJA homolog 1-like [Phoenix dactylifera]XP_008801474.2 protein NINJA homolog 1-like [Phoenix dactylifera]XP_008801475.2 protein NINJA homolog 1-like [Phoenix dactylifera]XP_038981403.1 protein NINJA homolog 1-like [Phoenix dactylifera]